MFFVWMDRQGNTFPRLLAILANFRNNTNHVVQFDYRLLR